MKVGLTNGCYDDLHDGHRLFLSAASAHCDYLIVAVNNDASVRRLKGEERPIFPLEKRILDIQALCSADVQAIIPFDGRVIDLVRAIKPDIIIRGWDQTNEGHLFSPVVKVSRFGDISTTSNYAKSRLS